MILYYAVTYYVAHMFEKVVDPILTFVGLPGYNAGEIVSFTSAVVTMCALLWFYLRVYAHFT